MAARNPVTDENRRRERAVAQLAPQKAGLARPSDGSRTDVCGQDICRILARTLHRILSGAAMIPYSIIKEVNPDHFGELT